MDKWMVEAQVRAAEERHAAGECHGTCLAWSDPGRLPGGSDTRVNGAWAKALRWEPAGLPEYLGGLCGGAGEQGKVVVGGSRAQLTGWSSAR